VTPKIGFTARVERVGEKDESESPEKAGTSAGCSALHSLSAAMDSELGPGA
jgi:hypothetical protein